MQTVEAPATGFALRGLLSVSKLAIVGGGTLGGELQKALAPHGVASSVVKTASELSADADGVIFLGGVAEFDTNDVSAAREIQREAFRSANAIANVLAEHGGVFVTVQDTGGCFGLSGNARAWIGGLPGLVKTAAQEWPKAGLRAIDIERGQRSEADLAQLIAGELLFGGDAPGAGRSGAGLEIALRADGKRLSLESIAAAVSADSGATRVDSKSVIVASGGARGVTATTLIRLAEETKASFVLLGRSGLVDETSETQNAKTDAELKKALLLAAKNTGEKISPKDLGKRAGAILKSREVRATLAAIEATGGRAKYVPVSVTDSVALNAALETVRSEWGPITGIVHGAGLIEDRFIADKTLDQFDRVFDTKVLGLKALLDATASDPLRILVAFSSVAGRCGNKGQCDYAMANETLNKVVSAEVLRRGGSLLGRSLGWGPWEGGMVTPALKAHFESLGVPLIGLETGAQMLVDELKDISAPCGGEIVLGGEPIPAALNPGQRQKEWTFDVVIDAAREPQLDAHRVQGKAVLPAAFVVELFARASEAARPDLRFIRCEKLRVLRGVLLDDFGSADTRLQVQVKQISNGNGARLETLLLDSSGARRYSAIVSVNVEAPIVELDAETPDGLTRYEGVVYDGHALFHGDAFRVIVGSPELGDAGLSAELEGGEDRAWPAERTWATDPALVDGALQLALLWTTRGNGDAALPTSIGQFTRHATGLVRGPLRAVLKGESRSESKSVSDVLLLDSKGAAVAELQGVEMHVLPRS